MRIRGGIALLVVLIGAGSAAPAMCEVKRAQIGDAELAYVEAGSGEVIVFVHGGLQDYRLWDAHLPVFSGRYHTVAYSRRNHYPNAVSIDGTPDGAADLHAGDLAALIKVLGFRRVHVVAHSAGAHAALIFASNHPEMVVTLVVNEPPASGLLLSSTSGRTIAADFNARLAPSREAFRTGDMRNAGRMFADAVGGTGTYDRRSEAMRQMMLDNSFAHAADATSARPRPVFTCEMAKRITIPTLIMQGTRSPPFFGAVVDELERCLANRERVRIDASHTVPAENPNDFDAAVLTFLSKHPNSPAP
ncbi:pimeloyl-ACP methyl ester carboxylesterase [Povalibacter uvarum]|uniref:Pimeloyl-ACP methyl ester carboxylesterase n=1 Tax=Povalibacter uvarum TaxID=732238 RepID=A0A841HH84_9GAMM|nr:alpha/beta hydrolase [Povalibacter uvarum]MBB6091690.1 pimeloyl-ACP methyl ester carboxylesterase [Povalibacter uvarum]